MASIKLSREALRHNLDIIAHQIGGKDKIAVVLKDNAYGHGAVMIAQAVKEYGVKNAVVRLECEALEIADFFDRILILADFPACINKQFTYAVNSLESISQFPRGTQVELKIDTGMHRNGIDPFTLAEAFAQMAAQGLICNGVFTHYRSADTLSSEWYWQRKAFEGLKAQALELSKKYGWTPRFHASNSAGTFRSRCSDDIVRVGIALYGCLEMETTLPQPDLKPVLSLWGNRLATRLLKAGQRIGYNGTYAAQEDEVISIYDVGYADGLNRLASNRFITPEGIALRGRISMDSAAFSGDADELMIFRNANEYARAVGTIGYEILACLDKDLKREWI